VEIEMNKVTALDGARAAQFLGALADLIEEPLALLV
jgi:hypothetical protein